MFFLCIAVNEQVDMMKLEALESCDSGTAARSYTVAFLMRNKVEADFWAVCRYYLEVAACSDQR